MGDLADALMAPPESVLALLREVSRNRNIVYISLQYPRNNPPDERKAYGSNNIGGGRRTCDSRADFV